MRSDKISEVVSTASELKGMIEAASSDAKEGKVQIGAIARLIALGIVWLNQIAVTFGSYSLPEISPSVIYLISSGATILVTLYGYWKNNSFSKGAKVSDILLNVMNESNISTDEVVDALNGLVDHHYTMAEAEGEDVG